MANFDRGAGAGVGYVRSVFSKREGCQGVAADLLRVMARVAGRVAAERRAAARVRPLPEGWRARVAATCADYLVSEPAPFSDRRGSVDVVNERLMTGPAGGLLEYGVIRRGFECDCLDAPWFVPAGGVMWVNGMGGYVTQRLMVRGGEQ